MSRAGDELAELLWDNNGGALRTTTPAPPFQPFTCSAAGSSRAHELLKRQGTMEDDDVGITGGIPVVRHHSSDDDDAVPWLHCPVIDDGDSDTAPLPPEYCADLLPAAYSSAAALHAVPQQPDPSSNGGAVVVPATQPKPSTGGEGIMNFTFFSRPLQRSQAAPSNPLESKVVQTAASRLRSTPLFSEQRMAWLQPPPKAPPPPPTDHHHHHHCHHVEAVAATVTQQHRSLQPPDARRAPHDAVTTSSVCSGNGDRSAHHQEPTAECSVSQDEDMDDEPGAVRRSAARGTKRSRTAEVHNLSERRRRDRINEKMRALQELIPSCNKIDKASMLEEAIEYLKTLQLQVQMMSMGTGMCVPPPMLMQMQVPPMAAPFPHLGMGLGFGMGAAAAFDMIPRFAGAQFPCPVMPGAPPGSMFGLPGWHVMPPSPAAQFPHMNGAAPAEQQREAAAVLVAGGAGAGDHHPPVAVAPHQGDQKLQHPKQT